MWENEDRRLASLRAEIFRYIDFFETYMRKFIERELKGYYGEEWIQRGVPENIRGYWRAHREFWINKGVRPEPEINYSDLKDYLEIICHNWENIFKRHFKGKRLQNIKTYFWDLKIRRDLAYHASYSISEDDAQLVKSLVTKLCVDEEARKELDEIIKGDKLTNTEIKIMGPLIFQLNGVSSAEEIAKLTDLPIHVVKMILRESFLRLGLVNTATATEIQPGMIIGAPILDEERRFKTGEEIYFLAYSAEEILRKHPEITLWKQKS